MFIAYVTTDFCPGGVAHRGRGSGVTTPERAGRLFNRIFQHGDHRTHPQRADLTAAPPLSLAYCAAVSFRLKAMRSNSPPGGVRSTVQA